jgi:antitoxin (DNA-binding transcriptional repressor) of toxin-antitoxin stability system
MSDSKTATAAREARIDRFWRGVLAQVRRGETIQFANADSGKPFAQLTPVSSVPGAPVSVRTVPASSDRSEDLTRTWLPTKSEQRTYALQEHREVTAHETARHLENVRAELRRHEEALAHYDHVFDLRLTGATRDEPSAASEGTTQP